MTENCLFCGIVAGTIPSQQVAENDRAIAFMDINPATRGHLLVVPRAHSTDTRISRRLSGATPRRRAFRNAITV